MFNKLTTSDWWSIFGTFLSLVGLAFGLYQYLKAKRIKAIVLSQMWNLYNKQNSSFDIAQSNLNLYKTKHSENFDAELVSWLGKQEIYCQTVFEDIILNICSNDENLNLNNIENYMNNRELKFHQTTKYPLSIFKKFLPEK